mmetsp:Transcript_10404/g.26179  ORF Transcript_10404/g.26179 Transcript_10404/m.26179 type:complete len:311 (-) Transcript_10404:1335-2267(-)
MLDLTPPLVQLLGGRQQLELALLLVTLSVGDEDCHAVGSTFLADIDHLREKHLHHWCTLSALLEHLQPAVPQYSPAFLRRAVSSAHLGRALASMPQVLQLKLGLLQASIPTRAEGRRPPRSTRCPPDRRGRAPHPGESARHIETVCLRGIMGRSPSFTRLASELRSTVWKGASRLTNSHSMMPIAYTSAGLPYSARASTSGAAHSGFRLAIASSAPAPTFNESSPKRRADRPKSATLASGASSVSRLSSSRPATSARGVHTNTFGVFKSRCTIGVCRPCRCATPRAMSSANRSRSPQPSGTAALRVILAH